MYLIQNTIKTYLREREKESETERDRDKER